MKKVINGKRYDTETARAMGYWENMAYRSDFNWYQETLLQKKTGEFFLHGEGNVASKYARSVGMNEWSSGEMIIPLTVQKAKEWAKEKLDADEYEKIFGNPEDDGEKVITTLSLSRKAHDALRLASHEAGVTMSEYIEKLVDMSYI